jgi:PAS domain S-box-containing protein
MEAGPGLPRAARVGRALCVTGAAIGAIGLIDDVTAAGLLARAFPDELPMAFNTGVGLCLAGGAGALRARVDVGPTRRAIAIVAAFVVLAIGVGTLLEYVLAIDLGIDTVVAPLGGGRFAGMRRTAAPTALALSLVGAALLLLDFRPTSRARPTEFLLLTAAFIALTWLFGFLFGAELRYRTVRTILIGAAFPTSAGVLCISVGLLLERPGAGVMRVATSLGPGGRQLRRFLLPALLVPVVLGLIVIFPLRAVDREALSVVVAVLASAMTLVGLVILTTTAVSLNRSYEALESSRAHTRALVEQAPDGVFIADIAGRYIDVNSAGCRMVGYTRAEILQMSITDVILPSEAARLFETRNQLLAGESGVSRWTLRRKDGSLVPVEANAKIFPDGRWQGLLRDISDQVRLERDLRAAEAEQKFMAELVSGLVSTLDDRETLQIIAQKVVADIADGCSVEEVEEDGRLYARVVTHRDPARAGACQRLEQLALDSPRPSLGASVRDTRQPLVISEVTPADLNQIAQGAEHRRLLDELGPRSCMALPLLAHGGVVGSLVFISSTAERRFSQADVPMAEAIAVRAALAIEKARVHRIAQDAIRLRDDVLSVVAHDLRNPLGTILLQVGLMRRDPGRERRAGRPADVIERAAIRMRHLIQDLLDVARMEGGRLRIEPAPLATAHALADAVAAHEALVASASLQLHVDAPADLPAIWADRERFLQVFENLIGNAIKFSAPGGRITVGASPQKAAVLFCVKDTGAGISEEDLPHVFERLWQGAGGTRHGAGLGLPIVKGIVEAHGGHIWVESKLGAGTTFFFTIPTAPAPDDWRAGSAARG